MRRAASGVLLLSIITRLIRREQRNLTRPKLQPLLRRETSILLTSPPPMGSRWTMPFPSCRITAASCGSAPGTA